MPTNEDKLKAKLVEMGFTYEDCANELGISKNTFYKKINNVEKFSIPQVNRLATMLNLSLDEKVLIFLN